MRWLTVCVPGQPEREILLEVPGPPAMDPETAAEVRELVTKGATGLGFILTTDDCRRTHAELRAKGVEFIDEPVDRFYGTDVGLRDPFGNNLRITQPAPKPFDVPESLGAPATA